MWWEVPSQRFDAATLWGTWWNIFQHFACLLPTKSCQHPPTCAVKLLISSFSIIILVRSAYELCVGSAGCAHTESAWRISESRGWSWAGWARQTLWSSSHMSAETQKNGWRTKCSHPFTLTSDACYICAWADPQLATLGMDEVLLAWLRSHAFHTVFVGGDWTSSGVVRQAPKAQRVSTQHKENGYVTTASLFAYAAYRGTRTQLLFSWGRLLWWVYAQTLRLLLLLIRSDIRAIKWLTSQAG